MPDRTVNQKEVDLILRKCLGYSSTEANPGFYIPTNLTMHLTSDLSPASWEAIYTHETIRSLLTYSWLGWTIQALDDLSTNLCVAAKKCMEPLNEIISRMMNIEYKKRKLCHTWLQTQEIMALYFQLEYLDIKKRAISLAETKRTKRLKALNGKTAKHISNDRSMSKAD